MIRLATWALAFALALGSAGTTNAQERVLPAKRVQDWIQSVTDSSFRQERRVGQVEVVNLSSRPMPYRAAVGLADLLNIVQERYPGFAEKKPVRVYYMSYGQFREAQASLRLFLFKMGIRVQRVDPRTVRGFFLPFSFSEHAIFLWEWSWQTVLHEIVHHGVTHHLDLAAGLNHSIISAESYHLWVNPEMEALVDELTGGS